ncbi:MAG: twitch domain-containing radical SAM protein [Candidatus Nanopelagicus sp.]
MQDPIIVENLVKHGKHFCVLPWIHFHSWPDGRVMPCCIADSNMPVAELKKDESIIQMMNSTDYKKMRTAMLNDEPVEACKRCYDLELMGTWTMRQSHNKRRGLEYVEDISKTTTDDGELTDFKMKYMDLRFSNMCNMKCRSCGPGCSSLWAQEFVDERGLEVYEQYFKTKKIVINAAEEMGFMNKLKPYLKDVTEVYFAGGEIIITPEHYECLDYWIENGLNEEIELTYTTNFSSLKYKDKDLIGYWKKFPKLKIWASLDAEGKVAETIRKGTDWDRIVRNIKTLREQVPHAEFQITPTISIWNVFDFPDFFDYMIKEGFINANSSPRFNLATNPWYANIMILPVHVKRRLVELYRVYQERYKDNVEIHNGFKMIIYNLTVGDENKGGILEFKAFNDELDEFRNEKLEDTIPELKEVYEWAKS